MEQLKQEFVPLAGASLNTEEMTLFTNMDTGQEMEFHEWNLTSHLSYPVD